MYLVTLFSITLYAAELLPLHLGFLERITANATGTWLVTIPRMKHPNFSA